MRTLILALTALSSFATACAPQRYQANTPAQYQSADGCAQVNLDNLYAAAGYANAYLTVASGDPAFPPWWERGTTDEHPQWTLNDPYIGQGFEGAVAFEAAERLGFSEDRVRFVQIDFTSRSPLVRKASTSCSSRSRTCPSVRRRSTSATGTTT
jgi:polar amino acid transport system substrate-binding protein